MNEKMYRVNYNHKIKLGCVSLPDGREKVMDQNEIIEFAKLVKDKVFIHDANKIIADSLANEEIIVDQKDIIDRYPRRSAIDLADAIMQKNEEIQKMIVDINNLIGETCEMSADFSNEIASFDPKKVSDAEKNLMIQVIKSIGETQKKLKGNGIDYDD